MERTEVVAKGQFTEKEWVEVTLFGTKKRSILGTIAVCLATTPLLVLETIRFLQTGAVSIFIFAPVICGVIFWFYVNWAFANNAKSQFRQSKVVQAKTVSIFTATSFERTTEYGVFRIPYADFHRVTVTPNLILCYLSDNHYMPTLRRFFESEEDFQLVKSWLNL